MTKIYQVYQCKVCQNIVIVLQPGVGQLVCCNQPMTLLEEKTQDEGQEKHVPVVEKTKDGIKVKVGSIPHPMQKDHWIQWIEVITLPEKKVFRQFLKPTDKPEAEFPIKSDQLMIRELCNLHGLWKTKS